MRNGETSKRQNVETARLGRFDVSTFRWFILLAAIALPSCDRSESPDFAKLMNVGKAHVENREAKKAIEVLRLAIEARPSSAPALRNLARAYHIARQTQDALSALSRAAKLEPGSAATSYLLGLTHIRLTDFPKAIEHLERAARLDPHTPAVRFQLATALQAAGIHDKAAEQLRETVRLDPLHASAHFKLAPYARRAGDLKTFQYHQGEFMRLRKFFGEQSRTAEALEQCVHTRAEPPPTAKVAAAPPTIEVRFTDVNDTTFATTEDRSATAAAVLDVDETGRCTLLVVDPAGAVSLLRMSPSGTFQRTQIEVTLPAGSTYRQCLVGDFHNDVPKGVKYDPEIHAKNDVLLTGPAGIRLLKRLGRDSFADVTEDAGLAGIVARRAHWVDYEHDGDLDLLLATESGLALWQNNGDGRFVEVTSQVGIKVDRPVLDVIAAELDGNLAVDLVVARGTKPTAVYMNQRAGRFAPMPDPPGPWPAADHVLADDLDNDGWLDTVLIAKTEAVVLYGHTTKRGRIDLSGMDVSAAALVDYDNDGRLDLCIAGTPTGAPNRGVVRLYRNLGSGDWEDVASLTGLDAIPLPPVTALLAVDADNDGDSDLLVIGSDDRLHFLRNDGGHLHGQLKLRLATVKTNPTALGVRVELRDGPWWVTRVVTGAAIEIGLGTRRSLDSVQTVWTNGIVDNQIAVEASRAPLTIVEKNVAAGSCPFLYVWDGQGFRFVTDLLGNAPVGLSLRRDVPLPADPDEIVLIGDAETFPPRDGAYTVVITDEFREILYLDEAKLLAIDHKRGTEVHATDKIMAPPFPPSEVWTLTGRTRLRSAIDDSGKDRTESLRSLDGVFAPPGVPLPPPLRGMCHSMSLVLDFGAIDVSRPLVLALTGWLQYGDASTNIALSQSSGRTIIPPILEVETTADEWLPVDVTVGMPAGKTKTILVELTGKLPPGAKRLRLSTTFEIRWDRIALFERTGQQDGQRYELAPRAADLQWRGFSQLLARSPGHPTTPEYDVVFDRPPWRTTLQGWSTRYGNVLELVTDRDDRLAVMNGGDALTLRFQADALPSIPQGYVRTFFLYTVGWDKDGDHNVIGGDVVGPLPLREPYITDDPSDWRLEYNTRWVPTRRFDPNG